MSTAASMRTQTAKPHPGSSSSHAGLLLQRKCACGSTTASLTGECAECKSKKRLQTKLTIGASNDPLEQEADRIADSVIRGEGPVSTRRGIVVGTHVQRHQSATAGRGVPSTVGDVLASRGTPIDAAVQGFMESRLGHDFSRVRIHTGAQASESARAVGASAYTVGNHIVFGDHALDVASESGRRLLAHELVHTIQQSASTPLLQRTCLPSALCPLVSVNLGGGGFNWEAAEVCLQTQYRSRNPGLVGSNKDWKILSGIPGTPEQ